MSSSRIKIWEDCPFSNSFWESVTRQTILNQSEMNFKLLVFGICFHIKILVWYVTVPDFSEMKHLTCCLKRLRMFPILWKVTIKLGFRSRTQMAPNLLRMWWYYYSWHFIKGHREFLKRLTHLSCLITHLQTNQDVWHEEKPLQHPYMQAAQIVWYLSGAFLCGTKSKRPQCGRNSIFGRVMYRPVHSFLCAESGRVRPRYIRAAGACS